MPINALTRRYARALFLEAAATEQQETVHDGLSAIAWAMDAEPALAMFLKHPSVDPKTKSDVLMAISGTSSDLLARFVDLVISRRRPHVLVGAAEAFGELWDQSRNLTRAHVRSALPLGPEHERRLADALGRLTAGSVAIEQETDAELVGGLAVRMGDTLVDGSLRTRLKKLADALGGR